MVRTSVGVRDGPPAGERDTVAASDRRSCLPARLHPAGQAGGQAGAAPAHLLVLVAVQPAGQRDQQQHGHLRDSNSRDGSVAAWQMLAHNKPGEQHAKGCPAPSWQGPASTHHNLHEVARQPVAPRLVLPSHARTRGGVGTQGPQQLVLFIQRLVRGMPHCPAQLAPHGERAAEPPSRRRKPGRQHPHPQPPLPPAHLRPRGSSSSRPPPRYA